MLFIVNKMPERLELQHGALALRVDFEQVFTGQII